MNQTVATDLDRAILERTLDLARFSVRRDSSPIGYVVVDETSRIISEGRNKSVEPWPKMAQRIGNSAFAHAEMDAFYRLKRLSHPESCTVYASLEPCLMCRGAIGMVQIERCIWACDDPWGGSGRLIAWNKHPVYQRTQILACLFPDLELESAQLFAPEAKVYPPEGWAAWWKRYSGVCAKSEMVPEQTDQLRAAQVQVTRGARWVQSRSQGRNT